MTRPPLTLALSLVLAAQVEGAGRPALLAATLHPEFGRPQPPRPRIGRPGLARIIPMPRVIPLHPASAPELPDHDHDSPDPAA